MIITTENEIEKNFFEVLKEILKSINATQGYVFTIVVSG